MFNLCSEFKFVISIFFYFQKLTTKKYFCFRMPLKTKRKKRGFTLCSHVYFNKMIFEFSVIASNLFKATTENAVDSEIQHNLNVVFGHSLMFVVNRTLGWSWCEKDKPLNLSFLPLNKPNISTSLYVMLDHLLCISFALVFVSLK